MLETTLNKICYNFRLHQDPGSATIPIITVTEDNQAFDHLRGAHKASEQERLDNRTSGEPESQAGTWQGFVFSVGPFNLATPCTDGVEIVPVRDLSPAPMTRDWVRGMQGIRGEVHTVVDFAAFIGLAPTPVTQTCNLLTLPDATLKSALLIAGRIRMESFSSTLPQGDCGRFHSFHTSLAPYLNRVVAVQDQPCGVLDVEALCGSPDFTQIGLY